MVFMLSTLSNKNYELYRFIVTVFEKIKVKGIAAPKVDCKGSNFRGLRGFNVRKCYKNVQVEKLRLKVSIQVASTKRIMKKILESFVSLVGTKDWKEAQQKYPNFVMQNYYPTFF